MQKPIEKLAELLREQVVPFELALDPMDKGGWRICIPQVPDWHYSIICHPGSYGYPYSLEMAIAKGDDDMEVIGWLDPEDVLKAIPGEYKHESVL